MKNQYSYGEFVCLSLICDKFIGSYLIKHSGIIVQVNWHTDTLNKTSANVDHYNNTRDLLFTHTQTYDGLQRHNIIGNLGILRLQYLASSSSIVSFTMCKLSVVFNSY